MDKGLCLTVMIVLMLAWGSTAVQAEDSAPPMPPRYGSDDKIITLVVENDSIGGGTDEHYTSGIRLTYFDVNAALPDVAYKLDNYIPTFQINKTSGVFYSLGQNLYTPEDITLPTQPADDRPWAAHLYGSMALVTTTNDHLDEVELSIGLVGPYALGEQTQKFIHKHVTTGASAPQGWGNQLKTEPTLGLGWVRRFPYYAEAEFSGLSLAASPYYGATIGNVHTYANTGMNIRLTPKANRWQDNPARVRPGLPGTGFFDIPDNGRIGWYLFAGVEGRAVARNIFLDGNTFRDSHSVDKNYGVADSNVGLALTYDQYRVSYTLVHRTREFKGQDDNTVFGTVSLGYRF